MSLKKGNFALEVAHKCYNFMHFKKSKFYLKIQGI